MLDALTFDVEEATAPLVLRPSAVVLGGREGA
jgi:hypothetical protein